MDAQRQDEYGYSARSGNPRSGGDASVGGRRVRNDHHHRRSGNRGRRLLACDHGVLIARARDPVDADCRHSPPHTSPEPANGRCPAVLTRCRAGRREWQAALDTGGRQRSCSSRTARRAAPPWPAGWARCSRSRRRTRSPPRWWRSRPRASSGGWLSGSPTCWVRPPATVSAPTWRSPGRARWSTRHWPPRPPSTPTRSSGGLPPARSGRCSTSSTLRSRRSPGPGPLPGTSAPTGTTPAGGWRWRDGWPGCSTTTASRGRRCCAPGRPAATSAATATRSTTTCAGSRSCGAGSATPSTPPARPSCSTTPASSCGTSPP